MAEQIVIYTDGACIPNPGKGGWAFLIVNTGKTGSGSAPQTTNNRMELMAICRALLSIEERSRILIKTDSRYSMLIAKKVAKPDKNPDLWQVLRELCAFHDVEFQWVKGHSTDQYNAKVDALANAQAS
jgi:ribonuclease HI